MILMLLWVSPSFAAKLPPAAAIATAHPMATAAGQEVLAKGGNAFDAAIAVSATLAVVEPYSSGIGGGGFWLLHRAKDGKQVMLDGRERAPFYAHRKLYQDKNGEVVSGLSIDGPLAAGIPGEPAALAHLAQHYGKLSLKESLAPAIRAAQEGFVVDAYYQRLAGFRQDVLARWQPSAKIFLEDGQVPEVGFRIKQTDLAQTLTILAEQGHDGFYNGSVAKKLVTSVAASGGIWTLSDLQHYRVVEREPIIGNYQGMRIVTAAPPSSGGIALITILNILSGYSLEQQPSGLRKHLVVEAMRRAYRDRAEYLGDPGYVSIPTAALLDPAYSAQLRKSIRMDRATPSAALPTAAPSDGAGRDTTHFSIIDRQGNRVAATLSINYPFGSGFVAEGTGVLLNDEMDDFSSKPGTPNVYGLVGAEANAIASGKRPLSSMTPTFLENEDHVVILGTPGGSRIITMVLLGLLEYVDGGDPQSMVALPRYHHQYLPDEIQYEAEAFTAQEKKFLTQAGHTLRPVENPYGNMQVVHWHKSKAKLEAASDARGVGSYQIR